MDILNETQVFEIKVITCLSKVFWTVLRTLNTQALIEKSRAEGQGEENVILEKLSNHLRKIGATAQGALSLDA